MKTITVEVHEDHLETLSRTKPMTALAELIWNALDAESTEIRIEFAENEMGGIETLRIVDNGIGLYYDDSFIVFRNLGGSWKRTGLRTHRRKRVLHGKYGRGRFRAFSLGNHVEWKTVYDETGDRYGYSIMGRAATLGQFDITDARGANASSTGMIVSISALLPGVELLRGVKALEEVTDIFAPYMRQYPDVKIIYDNVPLDPANAERACRDYPLGELVMQNGERVQSMLTVVEWNTPGKRGVFLCDGNGFMLHHALPRLYFRGFSYSAYLKSDYILVLEEQGLLQMEELSPDVRQMLDVARAKLREHFTLREAEKATDTITDWREIGLYPYEGAPLNSSEENERRIFEIYATHMNQIFPDFAESSLRNKRLVLRLVQELIRSEPTRMARILDELVDFPEDKEQQILELANG